MNNVVKMNTVEPLRPRDYTPGQLALVKRTVAADCNNDEFSLFIEVCKRVGLDPFRRQIYAVVYSKDNADKRKMSIITGIDGFRAVAARNRDYRPDEDEPEIAYDEAAKNPETNPNGIVKAVVRCWKYGPDGQWHKLTGVAYWDEFAPIDEEWAWIDDPQSGRRRRQPTGKMSVKGKWRNMGRVMIVKCAEAQAIRKGWPEDLSGIYAPEEMEQAGVIDASASDLAAGHERDERMKLIGAHRAIAMQWAAGEPLEPVPLGKFADRCFEFLKKAESPTQIEAWQNTNRVGLQSFWAENKADALAVKQAVERRIAELSQ